MAQNISDTMISHVIDHIAAVTKSYVGAYTTTEEEDMFQILVREQNPDDLSSGVSYAETLDDNLAAGTSYASIWATMLTWLTSRTSAAGYTTIDSLVAGRFLRVPHTFNTYVYYPTYGVNMTDTNVFPDQYWSGSAWTTYSLGTFAHGGSFVAGDTLPTTVSGFWGKITSSVVGPGSWTVEVNVTYTDASTGVETVVLTAGNPVTTDIGAQALIAFGGAATCSLAGGAKVYMDGPSGFVAGQEVLVWTGQYHALLTEDYLGTGAQVTISPDDAGCFNVGDSLTIDDEDTAGDAGNIILDINYETGLITFTLDVSVDNYTVAKNALIYKTTPDSVGHGEVHTVKSVAAGYVELTTNLEHTYVGTDCKCIRLLASIDDIATNAGGAGGDALTVFPCVERTITQGSII